MNERPPTSDATPPAMGEGSASPLRREYNCPGCGYDLAGLLDAPTVICPECARVSSSTLLKRLRPPPKLWPLILRLSLPFVIGIAVQAGFVLSAHWLRYDKVGSVGLATGLYWTPMVALIAMAKARVYWSEVSKGAHARRYRVITLLVIVSGSLVSLGDLILLAWLTAKA